MTKTIQLSDYAAALEARRSDEVRRANERERARRRRRNIEDAVVAVVAFGPGAFFMTGFLYGLLKWAFGF